MKHLKSSLTEFVGKPVVEIPIDDLFATVAACNKRNFYDMVKESVRTTGLINPLLVVKTSIENYEKKLEKHKDLLPLPEREFKYFIWGGSNRYYAARELGFDSVDCIIFDDFDVAFKCQAIQRNDFIANHTKGDRRR